MMAASSRSCAWMSNRAPTVSEIVGSISVQPVIHPPPDTKPNGIRPDFDTDVLWKPTVGGRRMSLSRGVSESSDTENVRRVSISEMGPNSPTLDSPKISPGNAAGVPVDGGARVRRMSFTEMIFGSPGNRKWSWSASQSTSIDEHDKRHSVTEDERFKEIMRHQNKILNDEAGLSGFKASDYMRKD